MDRAERTLLERGTYRIVAWAERIPSEHTPRFYVRVDERRGETWLNVVIGPARLGRAPWWRPWERPMELFAVVERCVRQVEALERVDLTAKVTIDAVAEANQAAESLVTSLPSAPRRYDRVYLEHHEHGDEDLPIYRGNPHL
jgi:hypothetical protein